MKKVLMAVALALLTVALFAGCSGGYKDGTYKAEAADFEHGWKDYVVVEIADGKAAIKEFDSLNEAGDKKSQNAEYRDAMEPVTGTYPEKYIPEILASFEAKGSTEKMDNITGATNSTNSFKALVNAALESAKKGDTATAIVSAASSK